MSDQPHPADFPRNPLGAGRMVAVALVLIVPIALLVLWFQSSNHDDAWDTCRAAIEEKLAPDDVTFNAGDHSFTDDGQYALANGTLTAGGVVYAYRCSVDHGVIQTLTVDPR